MSKRPSDKEAGVTTAPALSEHDELLELRREVARLRRLLEPGVEENDSWPETIPYGEQPMSGARLMGITRDRERVRRSSDFPELPVPTADQSQLEADFMRWGYCVVADVMDQAQIERQTERLLDQAEAEKAAGIAHLSHHGSAQLVFNLVPKGQAFRDLVALEADAAGGAPLVETLLEKILGAGFYLGTAHGSIVGQGGGRQELHQDQGFVPLPHPSYPLYCLIIWTYSDFNLEAGGTYIVPGSHRDAAGHNLVRPDTAYEALADERIVALVRTAGLRGADRQSAAALGR